MNPNETLRLAREALRDGDRAGAAYFYALLMAWTDNGGFEPDWASGW